jgi:hypothetical protein
MCDCIPEWLFPGISPIKWDIGRNFSRLNPKKPFYAICLHEFFPFYVFRSFYWLLGIEGKVAERQSLLPVHRKPFGQSIVFSLDVSLFVRAFVVVIDEKDTVGSLSRGE